MVSTSLSWWWLVVVSQQHLFHDAARSSIVSWKVLFLFLCYSSKEDSMAPSRYWRRRMCSATVLLIPSISLEVAMQRPIEFGIHGYHRKSVPLQQDIVFIYTTLLKETSSLFCFSYYKLEGSEFVCEQRQGILIFFFFCSMLSVIALSVLRYHIIW